jgi:hypothetical protein
MKAPPSARNRRPGILPGFTEQDVCNYAHHLWIQSGMSFDGDPWAEARACLAANLPPASAALAVPRTTSARVRVAPPKPAPIAPGRADFAAGMPS